MPAALDVRALMEMVGDDPDVIRQLLRSFRTNALRPEKEMHLACQNAELDRAASVAHKLTSSARSVGAIRLGKVCADIEAAARAAASPALTSLLVEFDTELLAVRNALDRALEQRP